VLAVYEAVRRAVERARAGGGPSLVETDTMRMRGHAEHDDMKYVPREMLEAWAAKDPILRFERQLLERGAASQTDLDGLTARIEASLVEDVAFAEASPFPEPETALGGVYGDREVAPPLPPLVAERASRGGR
jgi:TPP-dependent pyruvate/acetoin dehydrogenase alpha subunit